MEENIFTIKKTALGIDIADHTIEMAELFEDKGKTRVRSFSRINIEEGIVVNGRVKKMKELAELIKRMMPAGKPLPIRTRDAVLGLPESQVYYHYFEVKKKNKEELRAAVEKEAEEIFPIHEKDLALSYKIGRANEGKYPIFLYACKHQVIKEYSEVLKMAGLKPKFFDIEILALYRGLDKNLKKTSYLLDIGHEKTIIAVFEKNELIYTYSLKCAGKNISEKIARQKNIGLAEAENLKKTFGLDIEDVKIKNEIKASLKPLISSLKENIHYYNSDFKSKKSKEIPNYLVLAGGTSRMKGLVRHFYGSGLGKLNISRAKSGFSGEKSDDLFFIEAIGSALRLLHHGKYKDDIIFEFKDKKVKDKLASRIKSLFLLDRLKENGKIIVVIILFLISFILFYSYFSGSRKINQDTSEYQYSHRMEINLPVDTEEPFDSSLVSGRIAEIKIDKASAYEQALDEARGEAEKKKGANELVWEEPLNAPENKDSIIYPYIFKWLLYGDDYERVFREYVRSRLLNEEILVNDLILAEIKIEGKNLYLQGYADLLLKEQVSIKQEQESGEPAEDEIAEGIGEIKIKPLSRQLNVRIGPGVSYNIIGGAEPGSVYKLLSEDQDWYKIRIQDKEGWVSAGFADRLE